MAKTDAILMNIRGIKCDHCDYKDTEVDVSDYKAWLNKPCPKCGSSLLTKQDYRSTMVMIAMVRFFNKILPKVNRPNPNDVMFSAEMNGTGRVTFKRK